MKKTIEQLTKSPMVFMVARTVPTQGLAAYLYGSADDFALNLSREGSVMEGRKTTMETLVEFAGRLCYRSWSRDPQEGGNTNLTKVREDQKTYLENVLKSGHTSLLGHASMSFVIAGCTRVLTHELVRHHVGTRFSQESLRYVRLSEVEIHVPEEVVAENERLGEYFLNGWNRLQDLQNGLNSFIDPENMTFTEKKKSTSAFRRLMGMGVRTNILFTANLEALRSILQRRLVPEAEAEIQQVCRRILMLAYAECPVLFADIIKAERERIAAE